MTVKENDRNGSETPSPPSHHMPNPPPKVVQQAEGQEIRLAEPGSGALSWLKWSQSSLVKLIDAEGKLLARVGAQIISRFVKVRLWNSQIYTITVKPPNSKSKEADIPFVLVHGFAAGLAVWTANLDALAGKRTVHAFDILGFGRSSRPTFSQDATLAELEFVQSIEDWRKEMNIERMILVGHSFGAFLASSYTLEHPSRVRHLVLVDPWGFPEKPPGEQLHVPVWMRAVGTILSKFNPLATLRLAGPFGPTLVKKLRSDLGVRYAYEDSDAIYEYIYQCNAQQPTGEMAFGVMTKSFGWAKRPMIHRFGGIDPNIPVTFICGSKSWIDCGPAYEIQTRRTDSYVDVKVVSGAGHHVYADASDKFNTILRSISDLVCSGEDLMTRLSNNDEAQTNST
jgi:pimeloyl-ACP methyl ester carboxylesterase